MRVWREKDKWIDPFKLLIINSEIRTIDMPYGPANFRSTVIKSYYIFPETFQEEKEIEDIFSDNDKDEPIDAEE
jgi:hypothetical protein